MEKKIIYRNEEISYCIFKNKLSKRLKISIDNNCKVRVSIPIWMPSALAENFVKKKIEWIADSIKKMAEKRKDEKIALGDKDYFKYKEKARDLVKNKIDYYNQFYGLEIGIVAIRNQKTRWGSCSSRNNLNFNFKVLFLPEEFSNYIIVHEICHLQEMNHSVEFWNLVEQTIPNYKNIRRELKRYKI